MKDKKLSVIVPVYNVQKYLIKNIESLVNQTYDNIELIYVDDGSTDGSYEILNKYQNIDNRIKVIHNSNHGVSYTRNCGIDNSSGDYISFVDGDDYVDEDYAMYLINLVESDNSEIGISLYHHTDDSHMQDKHLYIKKLNSKYVIDEIYLNRIYMAVWNKIYSRSFLNKNNIRFNEKLWYAEGMHFNIQCLSKIESIYAGNKRIYHYISNPKSAMRKGFNIGNEECALRSLDSQRSILKKNNMYRKSLEFHYMMVNFFIIHGIYKSGSEYNNLEILNECRNSIKQRKLIPLIVNIGLKAKIKWFLIGTLPDLMAKR